MKTRVILGVSLFVAAGASAQPVQWRVEDGGNGHWYDGVTVSLQGVSWSDARHLAIASGGDLVSLNTPAERQWVYANVSSRPTLWTPTLGPWVGAFQPAGSIEPGGGWQWVDGQPLQHGFDWGPGAPDGNDNCGGAANRMRYWGSYGNGPGDFFQDGPDNTRNTCWNIDFGSHISYVVEFSADCNNDGIVDKGQILSGDLADLNNDGIPDGGVAITTQPTSLNLGAGDPVLFTVDSSVSPGCTSPTAFMWQRRNPLVPNETDLGAWIDLEGVNGFVNATTAALGIPHPTPGMATGFRCRLTSACGCESGLLYTDIVNFSIACPSDFNADGSIDGDDVIAFFENWDNGC